MKTDRFMRHHCVRMAILAATCLYSCGCVTSFRWTSVDSLEVLAPKPELAHSFFVESVDGNITHGNMVNIQPSHSEINDALARHHPNTFNRKDGAIPLHISYKGEIPGEDGKLFANPIHGGYNCIGGKITVTVLVDNGGDRCVTHIPWRRSWSGVLTPMLAPLSSSSEASNWHEVKYKDSTGTGVGRNKDRVSELIASGVVKALNRMSDAQMRKLLARTHQTSERKRLVAWLAGSPSVTFSVDDDGNLFTEAEHEYTPVPTDFAELAKLPQIVMQTFEVETRTGRIAADITGCGENQTIDYLMGRLVPEICRTKSVVFDPVERPPRGARYRIDNYKRKVMDGKDIVQIEFTALQ